MNMSVLLKAKIVFVRNIRCQLTEIRAIRLIKEVVEIKLNLMSLLVRLIVRNVLFHDV